jgi:putative restriction endonuclease
MPLSPLERIRLDKAAVDEGFGLRRPEDGDWLVYEGLGTPAIIRLTSSDGAYVVAVNHLGVASDLAQRWQAWAPTVPTGLPAGYAAFSVSDTAPLHKLVGEIRRLARALPDEPLRIFENHIKPLPRTTEAERLVVQRIGQNIFRDALLSYWAGQCAVTEVRDSRLLRASHIKPWASCETDAERLDVYNGLLLAAHLDAAFDAGLISFNEKGKILLSTQLQETDRQALGIDIGFTLRRLAPDHLSKLAWHRDQVLLKPLMAS